MQNWTPNVLSMRQSQILFLITEGMDNKTIAHHLGISDKTVKNQLTTVFRKLNVQSRTQAAIWALRQNASDAPRFRNAS
jgi:DNA-binding NarL/FixJ family response regulator